MKEIIIFGAGAYGRLAAEIYRHDKGWNTVCFIDNDEKKRGTKIQDIPVISVDDYLERNVDNEIIICAEYKLRLEMAKYLENKGITNYSYFTEDLVYNKERIVSWADIPDCEDVILYHALKDQGEIFWIDIGCNDPDMASVTKLFYEKGGSGINIDIKEDLIDLCKRYRVRDINLNIGVGSEKGKAVFYEQGPSGALSTLVESNKAEKEAGIREIEIRPLKDICKEYVGNKTISFLKIDVEGMEKDVLLGADFENYRPLILIIESTLPCTDIPNYDTWEDIVIIAGYHFVHSRGNNRYYVANEADYLDDRFMPWPKLASNYYIMHAGALFTC